MKARIQLFLLVSFFLFATGRAQLTLLPQRVHTVVSDDFFRADEIAGDASPSFSSSDRYALPSTIQAAQLLPLSIGEPAALVFIFLFTGINARDSPLPPPSSLRLRPPLTPRRPFLSLSLAPNFTIYTCTHWSTCRFFLSSPLEQLSWAWLFSSFFSPSWPDGKEIVFLPFHSGRYPTWLFPPPPILELKVVGLACVAPPSFFRRVLVLAAPSTEEDGSPLPSFSRDSCLHSPLAVLLVGLRLPSPMRSEAPLLLPKECKVVCFFFFLPFKAVPLTSSIVSLVL